MILDTDYTIRKMARKIKDGNARIVGRVTGGDRWPDEPHYYIIDDLDAQEVHHVACDRRPSWASKMEAEK